MCDEATKVSAYNAVPCCAFPLIELQSRQLLMPQSQIVTILRV